MANFTFQGAEYSLTYGGTHKEERLYAVVRQGETGGALLDRFEIMEQFGEDAVVALRTEGEEKRLSPNLQSGHGHSAESPLNRPPQVAPRATISPREANLPNERTSSRG